MAGGVIFAMTQMILTEKLRNNRGIPEWRGIERRYTKFRETAPL